MRYKIIVFILLTILIAALLSSCATTSPKTFYTEISKTAFYKISEQTEFDDGWWQEGEIHFNDGTIWYGEISRFNDASLIKFRRDTVRQTFSHVQLKGYVYYGEKDDHTFVFMNTHPRYNDVKILEVLEYGDIILYRNWYVKSDGTEAIDMYNDYWLISELYIQHNGVLKPWKDFDKDVLPLIEPTVYQNYVDIWGKKNTNSIQHQINIIRDHNEKNMKKS
jgi:hypothetical protein